MELLSVIPPGMPPTWFTAERLDQFWGYVKWTLSFYMPLIMICLAVLVVWIFTDNITDMFDKKTTDDKEEEDYDTRYY